MATIARLGLDEYVDEVLPHSFEHWGHGRSFERYVGDLRSFCATRYGERRFALFGIRSGPRVAASLKRYERDMRVGAHSLRTAGIGAVFVPPDQRGKGVARDFLLGFLRAERERGVDLAFLFSDIGPALYEEAGFEAIPSRTLSVRTKSLPSATLEPQAFELHDWRPIARCFDALPAEHAPALKRTPLVWSWLAHRSPAYATATLLRLMRGVQCIAYVVGRAEGPSGAFLLDDCGFDRQHGCELLAPLIRHAAGNLDHVHGWLPPPAIRALLPQGSVKRRAQGLSMIAPLSPSAKRLWRAHRDATLSADGDLFCWFDHV